MIGITKVLTGGATVSEAMRAHGAEKPHLIQFSSADKPVVVWNMTNRCNLECRHCYVESSPAAEGRVLSTAEARAFIDEVAAMGAPVLLFSGGEPLLRWDVYELAAYAAKKGLRPSISTNGTLITVDVAKKLKDSGVAYAGVSLDGAEATHDELRSRKGAFDEALRGLANAAAAGIRTGVRFTLNRRNAGELPAVLDVVECEGIARFCMYHLVYAGRGKEMMGEDVTHEESRAAVETLIAKAFDWAARGVDTEILTTDNHADGVMLLRYVERHEPSRAAEVRKLLEMAGGCSAGRKFACVGAGGEAHPCQFWRHESLGNVRERSFGAIWRDISDARLSALKHMPETVTGRRCGACAYKALCGGCRIRALVATGDVWGDDPQCYLTDEEIGLQRPASRAKRAKGAGAKGVKGARNAKGSGKRGAM